MQKPELACTPAQTAGPFFHCALPYPGDNQLVDDGIQLHGTMYDGAGAPIPDALVELWQSDPDGNVIRQAGSLRRDGKTFTGWGRCATDAAGHYTFTTLTPGPPGFFAMAVFARGLLNRLFTRAYLPDSGPLLSDTLLCVAEPGGYRFDIHLQGPRETVFFTYQDDPV